MTTTITLPTFASVLPTLARLFASAHVPKGAYLRRSLALQAIAKLTPQELYMACTAEEFTLVCSILKRERARYIGTYQHQDGTKVRLEFPSRQHARRYAINLAAASAVAKDAFQLIDLPLLEV